MSSYDSSSSSPCRWKRVAVGLLLGMTVVAAVWGVNWIQDPRTLPLRAIQLEGEFRQLVATQLEEAVTPYVSEGFFTVDVAAVRKAAEDLPWVYRASVRRIWPDILRIRVEEQKVLARWGNDGLVSIRGDLFVPASESIPAGLPELYGPGELREQLVSEYLAMQKAARGVGRKVVQLVQDPRRAWFMRWDNGVNLMLGRSDPYPRLLRFLRVYPDLLAANEPDLSAVDLRYSNGFAVRWNVQVLEEPGRPG